MERKNEQEPNVEKGPRSRLFHLWAKYLQNTEKREEAKQRIQRTKERVGELYPILIAKSDNPKINGKIVDGQTRFDTGDWKDSKNIEVTDWEDFHIKRIAANLARKGTLDHSTDKNMDGLYRIYRSQGFESEPAKRKMADIFGTSVRTIETHLSKKVKQHRTCKKTPKGPSEIQTTFEPNPELAGISKTQEEPEEEPKQELAPKSYIDYIQCPNCSHEFGYDVKKKKVVKAEEL